MTPIEAGESGAHSGWMEKQPALESATASLDRAKPRLWKALMDGLRSAYDSLGTVLIASVVWTIAAVLLGLGATGLASLALEGHRSAGLFAALGGAIAAGVGTGPLTVALFHHVRRLVTQDDPSWCEIWSAVGRLWRRGLTLAAIQIGATVVMCVDGAFFLSQRSTMLRLCGIAFVYPLLFWWGACLLQWPLAVERPDDAPWLVIKKSFLLVLDNLTYCCLFGSTVLLITLACVSTQLGTVALVLAWAGTLAFLQTAIFRELLRKYTFTGEPVPKETEPHPSRYENE
jgi:hypothetical protein